VKQAMRDDRRDRGSRGGAQSDETHDSEDEEGEIHSQEQEEDRKRPGIDRAVDLDAALRGSLAASQSDPSLPYLADQRSRAASGRGDASLGALLNNLQSRLGNSHPLLAPSRSFQASQRRVLPSQPLLASAPTLPSTGELLSSLLRQRQLQALAGQLSSSGARVAHGPLGSLEVLTHNPDELLIRLSQQQQLQQEQLRLQLQERQQQQLQRQQQHRHEQSYPFLTQRRQAETKDYTCQHLPVPGGCRLRIETEGDAAIRAACERREGPANGISPGNSHQFLRLNLTEILILTALFSRGFPCLTANADASARSGRTASSIPDGNVFTWLRFAELLEDVLGEWEVLDASQRGRLREGSIDAAHFERIVDATGQHVDKIIQDLDELPKRVIALVECLVRFVYYPSSLAGAAGGETTGELTMSEPFKVNYEAWFVEELCRWAISFDISAPVSAATFSGSSLRPVPWCASTFLADVPWSSTSQKQHDSLLFCLGSFDRGNAGAVLRQIAFVTRFRDIVEKNGTGTGVVALNLMVSDAVGELNRSNRVWKGKPSWWNAASSSRSSVEHDLALVTRLGRNGFRGVMQDDSSIDSQWQSLPITAIEERGRQLLPHLHASQVKDELARLLRERKNRFMSDNGLQTTASPAKRPRA
jgi:type II secretory pathway pseudopilin PulG